MCINTRNMHDSFVLSLAAEVLTCAVADDKKQERVQIYSYDEGLIRGDRIFCSGVQSPASKRPQKVQNDVLFPLVP